MITNKKTINVLYQTTFMFCVVNNDDKHHENIPSFNQTSCRKQKNNDEIKFLKNSDSYMIYSSSLNNDNNKQIK